MSWCRSRVVTLLFHVACGAVVCGCSSSLSDLQTQTTQTPPNTGVQSVVISPNRVDLVLGFTPSPTVRATANGGLSLVGLRWSVVDTAVASVAAVDATSALVTARGVGTTRVVATIGTVSGAIVVTVTDPPPMPWPSVAPIEMRVGDLVVRATTRPDSAPVGAPKGAVLYTTTASIRNAAAAPRSVRLSDCPMWISVHGGGSWWGQEGRPLEWDQIANGGGCKTTPAALTLASGESRTLATGVFAHELLAARVPANYRSYFHAHLRVDSSDVVVQADSAVITYPSGDLVPRAATTLFTRDTTRYLRTTVTLTNTGELPAYLEYGACAVRVLAYRSADLAGAPAWNSNYRRLWEGTGLYGCPAYLVTTTVKPGAEFSPPELTFESRLIEMLGDSLPDAHYYFTATVGFSNRSPIADIPAGDADVALPRPPMPATRIADLLTYRAQPVTVSVAPAVVRAEATATLDYAGSALVTFSRDCPLLLYVYRDRARRDAAPRSGSADWQQPACGSPEQEIGMNRGQTRTLSVAVPVQDILGGTLPAGHYYFAVVVQAQRNRVFLSAGEADLAR
jgi:hypothetical protein